VHLSLKGSVTVCLPLVVACNYQSDTQNCGPRSCPAQRLPLSNASPSKSSQATKKPHSGPLHPSTQHSESTVKPSATAADTRHRFINGTAQFCVDRRLELPSTWCDLLGTHAIGGACRGALALRQSALPCTSRGGPLPPSSAAASKKCLLAEEASQACRPTPLASRPTPPAVVRTDAAAAAAPTCPQQPEVRRCGFVAARRSSSRLPLCQTAWCRSSAWWGLPSVVAMQGGTQGRPGPAPQRVSCPF
jgi:hypothetical protein